VLYETRPDLSGAPLAPMHPIIIPARDGEVDPENGTRGIIGRRTPFPSW